MPAKLTPERKIKAIEKQLSEAKSILQAIQFMDLSETFPLKLKEALSKFLNDENYLLKLKREKENDLP